MNSKRLHEIYCKFPSDFPLPFILDGATGTALMKLGMPQGACTEEWVLSHPYAIQDIQAAYIRAGSGAIYSPTFGANRMVLSRHGIKRNISEINRELLSLSQKTVSTHTKEGFACHVAGDMSPTGCLIEPFGDTPFDTVVDIYAEQALALTEGGADFICIETGISLQETRAAVIAIKSVCSLPIFATLTFDSAGRTMSGDTLPAAIVTLANLGVCAVGANCSSGPDDMLALLAPAAKYAAAFGTPLIAKPNAGMPRTDAEGNTYFDLPPEEFGAYAARFLCAGVFVLGGCCGTDEKYIKLLREAADRLILADDPDFLREARKISTENLVATNRTVCDIRNAKSPPKPIMTDSSFADSICSAHDNGAELLTIHVTKNGADIFDDNEFFLNVPIILTGDKEGITQIKRRYNGHLIVAAH